MDNYIAILKKQISNLNKRIYAEQDSITAYSMLEKADSLYLHIFTFVDIINRNLQCGNYKRALRYYCMANALMNKMEENENEILRRMTDYIIAD